MSDCSKFGVRSSAGEKPSSPCTSPHEGRHVTSTVLPVHVDKLFTLMFTNSKFFYDFHKMRQSTDVSASSWQQKGISQKKVRTVSMVVHLGQPLAPTSNVQQTQTMLPCTVDGNLYAIDDEIVNSGIPYADSFYIVMHYCLEKINERETSLNIYSQIKYKKSMWGFVRNLIESNTWSNLQDHNECLVKALLKECKENTSEDRQNKPWASVTSRKPTPANVKLTSPKNTFFPLFKTEGINNCEFPLLLLIAVFLLIMYWFLQ